MLVIPAVDLKSSNIIRLYKGNFNSAVRYKTDVQEVVRNYFIAGIKRLHIVFLWGAHTGKLSEKEEETLKDIIKTRDIYSPECRIQIGGGIRRYEQIEKFSEQGIDLFILGTSLLIPLAMEEGFTKNEIKLFYQNGGKQFKEELEIPDPELTGKIDKYQKDKILVAVDYRKGETALSGWEVTIPLTPHYVIKKLLEKGYKRFVITNVDRDGTLEGIDIQSIKTIMDKVSYSPEKPEELIVSGGITTETDITSLQTLKNKPDGFIIGKALYQKKMDIRTLIKKFQI
jgi:phosphoribosylformimino-5-aminoimidazole carboxamide ribotide isomerase